jgi:TPR repeat protein
MSAPVRELGDEPSKDGPLNYAPKKVRHPQTDPNPAGAPPRADAAPQSSAPTTAEAPRRQWRQRGAFAGDVAIAELRGRLALAPDQLPEPPLPSTGPKQAWAGRLAGVAAVTAVGVIGYYLGSTPPASPPQLGRPSSQPSQQGLASERLIAYPSESAAPALASPMAAKAIVLQPNESRDAASLRALSRKLTVGAVQPRRADEVAKLMISAAGAGSNATVVIDGLAPGSAVSAGTQLGQNRWRLSVEELAGAAITPPRGFVGTMALTLELLAGNTVLDRKGLQLEWLGKGVLAAAKPYPRQHDAAELAVLMKNGAERIATGDIAGARLLYQRAAEEGEAIAAFALAETYDPLVLRKSSRTRAVTPDVALAQSWYEKAKELGSTAAPERLEKLARLPE